MNSEIMIRNNSLPTAHYTGRNLNRQMGRFRENAQALTDAAVATSNEVAYVSGHAQYVAVQTLEQADWIRHVRRGGRMSPAERAAYQQQDQQFLNTLNQLTRVAHMRLVMGFQQLALPDPNDKGGWLDRMDEVFFTRRT